MDEHQAITAGTGMPFYPCNARSPWRHGTNEKTNRLLRQYPTQGWVSAGSARLTWTPFAHELTHRPRKPHG